MEKINGSFRDPSGFVFKDNEKILRAITHQGRDRYIEVKNASIIEESIKNKFLINTYEIKNEQLKKNLNVDFLLEHELIPYVSYPYEWSFSQLRDAAIHHLNYQLFLLEKNFELIDASAYNIQFIGSKPIFIDCLSINKYQNGNQWKGQRQFCEHFLNPLIFTSYKHIPFNNWYRGNFEGLKNYELLKLINFATKCKPVIFFNIFLPSLFDNVNIEKKFLKENVKKKINKNAYIWLINSLKKFILNIKNPQIKSIWGNYYLEKTYSDLNYEIKIDIVKNFVKKNQLKKIIDIGCNDGFFSEHCLASGADYVVGFDNDSESLEKCYNKSKKKELNFLPLYLDASNPSSSIGWFEKERDGFLERSSFDGLISLAFEHHLAIGKNIPLEEVVLWLLKLAPKGLIEFVPKEDETVKIMLKLKGDIFPKYTEENFAKILSNNSKIINIKQVGDSGRKIYEYSKII